MEMKKIVKAGRIPSALIFAAALGAYITHEYHQDRYETLQTHTMAVTQELSKEQQAHAKTAVELNHTRHNEMALRKDLAQTLDMTQGLENDLREIRLRNEELTKRFQEAKRTAQLREEERNGALQENQNLSKKVQDLKEEVKNLQPETAIIMSDAPDIVDSLNKGTPVVARKTIQKRRGR